MNEMQEERTLTVVAAEINALTGNVLNGIIEIGRRMCEAKEMLPYGTFGDWIRENTGYGSSTANNFMRLYREYGDRQGSLFGASAECQTFGKLSYTKALALLSVPPEEREAFAAEVDAEHISTRELEEAIKARDEAHKAALEYAERLEKANAEAGAAIERAEDAEQTVKEFSEENVRLTDELAEAQRRVTELENRPVEVAVQEPSREDIDKAVAQAVAESEKAHAAEVAELKSNKDSEVQRADKLAEEKKQLTEKLKEAKEKLDAAEAGDAAERDKLSAEVERLKKQIAMGGAEMQAFKLRFEDWQKAYNTVQTALDMLAPEQREKCEAAVKAVVESWRADNG